jgi:hypothetical protein
VAVRPPVQLASAKIQRQQQIFSLQGIERGGTKWKANKNFTGNEIYGAKYISQTIYFRYMRKGIPRQNTYTGNHENGLMQHRNWAVYK